MAFGTSASAWITLARASSALAFHFLFGSHSHCAAFFRFCLRDILVRHLPGLFAGQHQYSYLYQYHAISIERISNAVPASSPLRSTSFDMESGFSSTDLWFQRNRLTKRYLHLHVPGLYLRRHHHQLANIGTYRHTCFGYQLDTVLSATAVTGGVSITLGLTDICTASKTSRPARSIAVAIWNGSSILAFDADTNAWTTRSTCPPARIVCFKFITGDVAQTCFMCFNHTWYDDVWRNITDTHQKKLYQRDINSWYFGW